MSAKLLHRARDLAKDGMRDEAREILLPLARDPKFRPPALALLANLHAQTHDYATSRHIYASLIRIDPNNDVWPKALKASEESHNKHIKNVMADGPGYFGWIFSVVLIVIGAIGAFVGLPGPLSEIVESQYEYDSTEHVLYYLAGGGLVAAIGVLWLLKTVVATTKSKARVRRARGCSYDEKRTRPCLVCEVRFAKRDALCPFCGTDQAEAQSRLDELADEERRLATAAQAEEQRKLLDCLPAPPPPKQKAQPIIDEEAGYLIMPDDDDDDEDYDYESTATSPAAPVAPTQPTTPSAPEPETKPTATATPSPAPVTASAPAEPSASKSALDTIAEFEMDDPPPTQSGPATATATVPPSDMSTEVESPTRRRRRGSMDPDLELQSQLQTEIGIPISEKHNRLVKDFSITNEFMAFDDFGRVSIGAKLILGALLLALVSLVFAWTQIAQVQDGQVKGYFNVERGYSKGGLPMLLFYLVPLVMAITNQRVRSRNGLIFLVLSVGCGLGAVGLAVRNLLHYSNFETGAGPLNMVGLGLYVILAANIVLLVGVILYRPMKAASNDYDYE